MTYNHSASGKYTINESKHKFQRLKQRAKFLRTIGPFPVELHYPDTVPQVSSHFVSWDMYVVHHSLRGKFFFSTK